ncbi:MAG: hypothetical protein PHS63_05765 [Desulfoplanes sp.]|nr:hypothetical protein [Desulfoplanes sp.]
MVVTGDCLAHFRSWCRGLRFLHLLRKQVLKAGRAPFGDDDFFVCSRERALSCSVLIFMVLSWVSCV